MRRVALRPDTRTPIQRVTITVGNVKEGVCRIEVPHLTILQPIVDIGIAGRDSKCVFPEYNVLLLQMLMYIMELIRWSTNSVAEELVFSWWFARNFH